MVVYAQPLDSTKVGQRMPTTLIYSQQQQQSSINYVSSTCSCIRIHSVGCSSIIGRRVLSRCWSARRYGCSSRRRRHTRHMNLVHVMR